MIKITGSGKEMRVVFTTPAEWTTTKTVVSTDSLVVTLCEDGTVLLRSKDGRLVQSIGNIVLVFPGWFDRASEQQTSPKRVVFKNSRVVCYEVTQKSNERKGYVLAFRENIID